ncbi:MAG: hypothetical protein H7211_08355 [Aquabacterium sp.]|nr:hypothetical protein [Ferruginibacter sp.]
MTLSQHRFHCPGKEAAMVIIVVSLPCTAYLCGTLIALLAGVSRKVVVTGVTNFLEELAVVI